MCYKRFYIVAFISFVFFAVVKASCLEYGHSCWGAHGKRSGSPDGGGKHLRSEQNLRRGENEANAAAQATKTLFDNIDDLNSQADSKTRTHSSIDEADENNPLNSMETASLRNVLQKYNARLRSRNRINDDSLEREERLVERWRKLPIFNLKPLSKSQLINAENDLLQQPPKNFAAEESFYYDFQ